MAEQVEKISKALNDKKIDLEKLFKAGVKERKIEHIAAEWDWIPKSSHS